MSWGNGIFFQLDFNVGEGRIGVHTRSKATIFLSIFNSLRFSIIAFPSLVIFQIILVIYALHVDMFENPPFYSGS